MHEQPFITKRCGASLVHPNEGKVFSVGFRHIQTIGITEGASYTVPLQGDWGLCSVSHLTSQDPFKAQGFYKVLTHETGLILRSFEKILCVSNRAQVLIDYMIYKLLEKVHISSLVSFQTTEPLVPSLITLILLYL